MTSAKDKIVEELQTELDGITAEVMTERRKRPDLTEQQWLDSLPMVSLPSLSQKRK